MSKVQSFFSDFSFKPFSLPDNREIIQKLANDKPGSQLLLTRSRNNEFHLNELVNGKIKSTTKLPELTTLPEFCAINENKLAWLCNNCISYVCILDEFSESQIINIALPNKINSTVLCFDFISADQIVLVTEVSTQVVNIDNADTTNVAKFSALLGTDVKKACCFSDAVAVISRDNRFFWLEHYETEEESSNWFINHEVDFNMYKDITNLQVIGSYFIFEYVEENKTCYSIVDFEDIGDLDSDYLNNNCTPILNSVKPNLKERILFPYYEESTNDLFFAIHDPSTGLLNMTDLEGNQFKFESTLRKFF